MNNTSGGPCNGHGSGKKIHAVLLRERYNTGRTFGVMCSEVFVTVLLALTEMACQRSGTALPFQV